MKATLEKKEKGFALIEVMMAALVLTVGCLAFLKLQHRGLQYSFNDYARSQGVAITQGFVEKLRGNTAAITTYKNFQIFCNPNKKKKPKCTATTNSTNSVASTGLIHTQMQLTQQQMQNSIKGQTILCYVKKEGNDNSREVRLTFMWIDSTAEKDARSQGIKNSDCPEKYGSDVDGKFIDNSVTIYATI